MNGLARITVIPEATCDICGLPQVRERRETTRWFCAPFLTGSNDKFCYYCFVQWYDNGKTNSEEIKEHSIKARFKSMESRLPT